TGFVPQAIIASSAQRTAATADFFGGTFGVPVELQDRLYGAPAPLLLRAAVERAARTVLVVAHNPGISVLAGQLSGGVVRHMPTCAVATFTWDDDSDVAGASDPASWTFETPRDVIG